MLFELSLAKSYLLPKKKRLAMSLIGVMSILVISLVVWLVLVFLSITSGLKTRWIKKVTDLNAPIQITPTREYYDSYYYKIDSISRASQYTCKSISEKRCAKKADPYDPSEDCAIPLYWPSQEKTKDGSPKDLVHLAFSSIEEYQKQALTAEEYEIGVGQIDLQSMKAAEGRIQLGAQASQFCYLSSLAPSNPNLSTLISPPTAKDITHALDLSSLVPSEEALSYLKGIISSISIKKIQTTVGKWAQLPCLIPNNGKPIRFFAKHSPEKKTISSLTLPSSKEVSCPSYMIEGEAAFLNGHLFFTSLEGERFPIAEYAVWQLSSPLSFEVEEIYLEESSCPSLSNLSLKVKGNIGDQCCRGKISWEGISIEEGLAKRKFSSPPPFPPPWVYFLQTSNQLYTTVLPPRIKGAEPIILPKKTQEMGMQLCDHAALSYKTMTFSSLQEQLVPLTVAGFYDPGVVISGLTPILARSEMIRDLNLVGENTALLSYPSNGIAIWLEDLSKTSDVCKELQDAFTKKGIDSYWKITPFYNYDFVQDLFQQFKSDQYLLTIIGSLILLVACTNIISLLVILVVEKKKEIAILRAMGASKGSIALLFTLCGGIMGLVSVALGSTLAFFTLLNIDPLIRFLSFFQGHELFHATFYGHSLPNEFSTSAFLFIAIATPILSVLAGLIPAIQACRYHPSTILRS